MAKGVIKAKIAMLLAPLRRLVPERKRGLAAPVPLDPARHGIALVAIVKDEALYIREWIAFHLMLGVRSIYIYDNGSTDSTLEEARAADPAGQTRIIPWRNFDVGIRSQNAAYAHALANFGVAYRWMAFIDIDEFLVPKEGTDLITALEPLQHLPGVSLPWHMFGPSGHKKRPVGLVTESYIEKAPFPPSESASLLLNYKSIVDPTAVSLVKTHHAEFWERPGIMYNDRGDRFAYADRFDAKYATADRLQLNHYFTRSYEDLDLKIQKGRISRNGSVDRAGALREVTVAIAKQAQKDDLVLRFVPALKRKLSA